MSAPDLLEQFTQQAEAVAAVVRPVSGMAAALVYAVELCPKGRALAATGFEPELVRRLGELCAQRGVELVSSELRARAQDPDVALTPALAGVAATGTVVVDSASEQVRLSSMLARVHVAVLPASRIVADLGSLERELDGLLQAAASYVAFITGPSRTADIERVLTIGAHGPAELHVLVTGDRRP